MDWRGEVVGCQVEVEGEPVIVLGAGSTVNLAQERIGLMAEEQCTVTYLEEWSAVVEGDWLAERAVELVRWLKDYKHWR
jgi:hypothetical protein